MSAGGNGPTQPSAAYSGDTGKQISFNGSSKPGDSSQSLESKIGADTSNVGPAPDPSATPGASVAPVNGLNVAILNAITRLSGSATDIEPVVPFNQNNLASGQTSPSAKNPAGTESTGVAPTANGSASSENPSFVWRRLANGRARGILNCHLRIGQKPLPTRLPCQTKAPQA